MNKNNELYEINTDIMRYKNNKASYLLSFLAIILDVVMFITLYKTTSCTPNIQLGCDLLINVLFMLAAFLTAEKVKVYDQKWGIFSIVLGGIEALRILWIPTYYHNLYLKDIAAGIEAAAATGLPTGKYIFIISLMLAAAITLVIGGIIAIIRGKRLANYLASIDERK